MSSPPVDAKPRALPLPEAQQRRIDAVVHAGLKRGDYPGAVVLVLRDGHTVFERAYGARSIEPSRAEMTASTVFDLASLTKPVATATAVMILRDRKKIALSDTVARHLPQCSSTATIEELLTHRSGLPAANALKHYTTRATAVAAICAEKPRRRGRELYSDLGYILLAEIVARVSGAPFAAFCRDNIFSPLSMNDTRFAPEPDLRLRAAPTEARDGAWLEGVVHDPRAAALDGVAGHAGLFSTAADLARWTTMLLGKGALGDVRVLSEEAVARMLPGRTAEARTLALARSAVGGAGHTGFTGTSLWLDPARHAAVILLTSRLHPSGQGDVTALRRDVRRVVLDVLRDHDVSAGVDVLVAHRFRELAGKRVGLITNASGRSRSGASTRELLHQADDVKLVALFSPEHGIAAAVEGSVADGRDAATGVPIYSLYGASQRPTAAQLSGIDTLVYDMQSVGARFYTYETTLGYALETAAAHDLRLVVLDRPNPIGGVRVEGPLLEAGRRSFVGYHTIPVRHGMTVGELAGLFNAERAIGAELTVVPVTGWQREQLFPSTGLPWTDPSPNIRSAEAALCYPGLALLEMTNVSVGRGTDAPFTRVGAPWIDASKLLAALENEKLPGLSFEAETFTPSASRHAGAACRGVRVTVTDPAVVDSVRLGLVIAVALRRHHRNAWQAANLITLLGSRATVDMILAGRSADEIVAAHAPELEAFRKRRAKFLLY